MVIKRFFLVIMLWVGFFSLSAQVLVSVNKAISKDTLVASVQKNSISSKTLYATGEIEFLSKSGYVRILLSDDYAYDLLLYESFPLVAVNGIDSFNNATMEAVDIPSHLSLTKIRVEIKNAVLNNLSINMTNIGISKTQQQQVRTDRIALINSNLRNQNALWVAGETPVSQMSYEEKKGLFDGSVPDLQGFEYYIGGVFEWHSDSVTNTQTTTRSPYVSSFDWRNRHGADNPSSLYYNSGGHGWVTSIKEQIGGTCWVYAGCGATEALLNIYFNQHINLDLAEQDIISCCSCRGPWAALSYIMTSGVVQESCFPHIGNTEIPCSNKLCNTNLTKITNVIKYDYSTEDELKRMIINNGPLSGTICPVGEDDCHAMVLIGFGVVKQGDCIGLNTWNCETIPAGHSSIGQTYWIFKNSWGGSWGENGFVKILYAHNQITAYAAITPIINPNYSKRCVDLDGDGYYYWGGGTKPSTCPSCAPDEEDGDDSDPTLGPMDKYGNCRPITPLLGDIITTSQTWNTNKTMSNNVIIPSGVTLTITATAYFSTHTITVRCGGELIVSGGTIDDGNVVIQGKLTISNNGKIILGSYDNLEIELGAEFDMYEGEILSK